MNRSIIVLLLGASFAAAIGQILFRLGARDRVSLLAFVNPYIALGMVFYGREHINTTKSMGVALVIAGLYFLTSN
jgi:drug/metabolite transporter (DMT)-like permease